MKSHAGVVIGVLLSAITCGATFLLRGIGNSRWWKWRRAWRQVCSYTF